MKWIVPLSIVICVLAACNKKTNFVPAVSNSCLNFTILDSTMPDANIPTYTFVPLNYRQEYVFNDDSQLVKHTTLESIGEQKYMVTISDSFAYENGNMVKSYFSLDSNNSSAPYTTSEYDYSGHTLTGSRYYLGNNLIVHSTYVTDSLGKIISVKQYADNTTLQSTATTTMDFVYDQDGNLYQIKDLNGTVYYKYLNYDDHPNPYYKLPFDYAYNIWEYCSQVLSKNNPQISYTYLIDPLSTDSSSNTYSYSYDPGSRVSVSVHTPSNGRVSNGPGVSDYSSFQYGCN